MTIQDVISKMIKEEKDPKKHSALKELLDYINYYGRDHKDEKISVRKLFELCEVLTKEWPDFVIVSLALGMLSAVGMATGDIVIDEDLGSVDISNYIDREG